MSSAPAASFKVIGRPVPRVEGADKVSGRSLYTADVELPGTLWGKNVRSPFPHARIVSIDPSCALRLPGVRAVLTAKDLPNVPTGRNIKDVPLLCSDRVRFVGDRVAVVAADDRRTAEEAALLVDVEYEELPAVFEPTDAMQPSAPSLHPNPREYLGFPEEVSDKLLNVCGHGIWDRGDLAQGFSEADLVMEHTFDTPLAHQGYLEPTACLVDITAPADGRGERVEVWASNKVPYSLRAELARLFDRPEEDIRVHAVTIGADFGAKSSTGDIPQAYYLAKKLGRPVRFVNSAQEDFTAASPKHAINVTLRTGVKRDGKIVAHDAKVLINRGAYTGHNTSANGLLGGAAKAANFYEIPNLHIEAFAVYTNLVPCGFMRAPGSPQVLFAVEAHMSLLARELGIDPVEFRKRNVPELAPSGAEHLAPRILQAASDAFGWQELEKEAAPPAASSPQTFIGRGVSLIDRSQGAGEASSAITVNPDGTVTALTSMPDNGTGGLTVVAAVVAESFGIPLDRVRLVRGSTDALPIDVESGGSRMTNSAGHAVLAATAQIKEQLAPFAAQAIGAANVEWVPARRESSGVEQPGGWQSDDGRFISLEDVATELIREGEPLAHAQVTLRAPRSPDNGVCVQMAEVEVDSETGQVKILRLVTAQDVGTIINTVGHQGQINGAVVQGVGHGLMEEMLLDGGHVTTPNFNDYKMPTIQDIPSLTTVNVPEPGLGPFDAKSIGEIPTIPTGGVIANAVADAIGRPLFELPITAERVLAAINNDGS